MKYSSQAMRIVLVADSLSPGGVSTYLSATSHELMRRGHALALVVSRSERGGASIPAEIPVLAVDRDGEQSAFEGTARFEPTLLYSHDIGDFRFERRLAARFPMVKFMHGFSGTCLSGLKMHAFPTPVPCSRPFGAGCFALYGPRKCGPLRISKLLDGAEWTLAQRRSFLDYRAVVVASAFMRDEYGTNGVPADRIHVAPLFAPREGMTGQEADASGRVYDLLFVGRMTEIKGGDVLLRATARAQRALGRPLRLAFAGDGARRSRWERDARRLGVSAEFFGWCDEARLASLYRSSRALVVPSQWPEPFGLIGLEAAQHGLPSIAFDVGGIREWLVDGESGILVPAAPPSAAALAKGLAGALSNPVKLEAMRAGARAIARRMTVAAHVDRLEAIFAGVLGQARPI